MQLLDAILAFALTMAALATVVTVIMETCLRIARMRRKNLIEVMKLLNQELGKGSLNLTPEERWDFFVKVVRNPAESAADILSIKGHELLKDLHEDQKKVVKVERTIASLGRDKTAGANALQRFGRFLIQLFRGDKKRAALYENVSLEYMLRCLAEVESVKPAAKTARSALKVELNRLARKYEELGSSVSASFKHHAQYWSILIGIALALGANIDGLRLFKAYRVDPNLATAVIETQEKFIENYQNAKNSFEKFDTDYDGLKKDIKIKTGEIAKANQDGLPKAKIETLQAELNELNADLDKLTALRHLQQTAQRAQQQMADLVALGVPMGWTLYPGCPYGGNDKAWTLSSPKCKAIPGMNRERNAGLGWLEGDLTNTLFNDPGGFFLWLFVVIVTGILIGLGAPFWFDIAKRLSQIRKGLQSASASTEYRLSASNANGDYEKRKQIVANVIEEAADEA